ncbi:hypothetical protein Cni_G21927 [Canna indica]|uniref:Uncharacterized protein n=1 Tax=Canna indica TaxID=4628 RepID=A0AAQ3KQG9_9LILI|nr:hypothetical protein Cni_G21927 [Canna indica]
MEREFMENETLEDEPLALDSHPDQTDITWKHELEFKQSNVEELEEKSQVMVDTECSIDDSKKELEFLLRRVKTTATMLTYLKSKARIMAIPQLAHTSCGIKHQEGVGLVDKHGTPLSDWSKDIDLSTLEDSDEEVKLANTPKFGSGDSDGAYDGEILNSVRIVTDVMECLLKRVIMAESEALFQKEKVKLGMEENRKKTLQIEIMSAKVEEMEKFALGANSILSEMRQKVEDMVQETSRHRQQAEENKQELRRVKQNFETLRSFVRNLISVREVLSSEQQFQSVDELFDRLIAETSHLENEKVQKEAEVQKLIKENARLRALLDNQEAQLLAMNEQCKFMALTSPGI